MRRSISVSRAHELRSYFHIFLIGLLIFSIAGNVFFLWEQYRAAVVVSVPDGDSLDLADGRRVRLLGLDAPERGRCGADEARETLIGLAIGHHVVLKNTVTDDYGRTLANVMIGNTFLNRIMVERGLAKYSSESTEYRETLKAASDHAKSEKLGIYSPACRSTDPTTDCVIKGNIRAGQKTYHSPECKNYYQTIIDTSFGDRWFCSEAEAIAAGYKQAGGCPPSASRRIH